MYLNCHSYYSFKYGVLSPDSLISEARRCGVHKLMLTDINNTSAWVEMLRLCGELAGEYELQVGLGIEFRNGAELQYIGLAAGNPGFEALNRFLSAHNAEGDILPVRAPELTDTFFIYPTGIIEPQELRENEYLGVRPSEVYRIARSELARWEHKLVVLHPVTFRDKTGYNVHRLLQAVARNTVLSKLGQEHLADPGEIMLPEAELLAYYWQYPRIIANTKSLIEQCRIDIDLGNNKNKALFGQSVAEDHRQLRSMALEGFRRRYSDYNPYAMQRLLRELDVIAERQFEAYFLIAHDLVCYARHRNFAHVGRGSGANSMVAYCLEITEVDPIELDLYFERFLNPYRSSPPDFDIDFSWKDRDEVTAYLLKRYGTEHAVLLATFNTFQGRSVIRELGKVFGLPKDEIDMLVEHPFEHRNRDEITRLIFRYAERIQDMPQNLSIHAGGVLITELPIYAYTATDLPPKGFPITHFDMYGAEDLGIHKFDILSQRGLGHIKDTVELVERTRGIKIDIGRTGEFKADPKVNRLLREGRCMGCFYIESPAMRMLLNKLRCDNYITLVAASSIIRPGVARSGMMREYIQRHHHPDSIEYIHPVMGELMKETYGVMVYQEDVIKVAHHFAGLDLAEADILRRGMSGKFRSRSEFRRVEEKFFGNCRQKGYPEAVTREVWRQIESFSGYSFSKAHSASYAVESYQSLYLKAYYPLEFMVGVINNFGGFYRTEFYVHEARMSGARIEAPCANRSDYLTRLDSEALYLGFIHLKGLEQKFGEGIPRERERNGPYRSIDDFLNRMPLGLEQCNLLIRIGALRFTGQSKQALLWEARLYFGREKGERPSQNLFFSSPKRFALPELHHGQHDDAFDELELLGFPLCDPFELLPDRDFGDTRAPELMHKVGRKVCMTGYMVTTKNTHTKDNKLMHFGTFLDCNGEVFDTTHFPPAARRFPFRGRGFYRITGKVAEDFGYPMVEVESMTKLSMVHKMAEETVDDEEENTE